MIFWIHFCRPRIVNTSFTSHFFFFNKTFNIRLISVSSAESTFCVGTDVKRFSRMVGMRVTDSSRLHCAARTALDRLFAAREILNISGSVEAPRILSKINASFAKGHIVRADKRIRKLESYTPLRTLCRHYLLTRLKIELSITARYKLLIPFRKGRILRFKIKRISSWFSFALCILRCSRSPTCNSPPFIMYFLVYMYICN